MGCFASMVLEGDSCGGGGAVKEEEDDDDDGL